MESFLTSYQKCNNYLLVDLNMFHLICDYPGHLFDWTDHCLLLLHYIYYNSLNLTKQYQYFYLAHNYSNYSTLFVFLPDTPRLSRLAPVSVMIQPCGA